MRKIFFITLLVLLLSGSISSVHAYTNAQYSFSIDPPSGWIVDDDVTYAAVCFYGPIDQDFRVNVNIQVEPTSASLAQYISSSKLQLQTFDNYQLLSEESRTINGVDAAELVFQFSISGQREIVQEKIVASLVNGKAFTIIYAALPTTYQTYLNAFESSVQTFKVEAASAAVYGLDWWMWVIIAAVIVGVVAAAVAFVMPRRKKFSPIPPP